MSTKSQYLLKMATIGTVSTVMLSQVTANWNIENPTQDETYTQTSAIAGDGDGPCDEGFTLKVRIGGDVENSASGSTGPIGDWDQAVDAPPAPGWTITMQAFFELWDAGQEQERVRVIIN